MKFKIFMILACSFACTIEASLVNKKMTFSEFISQISILELDDENYCKTTAVLDKVINAIYKPIENELINGRGGVLRAVQHGDFSYNGEIAKLFYKFFDVSQDLLNLLKKTCKIENM